MKAYLKMTASSGSFLNLTSHARQPNYHSHKSNSVLSHLKVTTLSGSFLSCANQAAKPNNHSPNQLAT